MDHGFNKCKGCGFVFDDMDDNIDECAKKRLYCEICLAQKNPISETEQRIQKRHSLITITSAFLVLIVLIATNWEKSRNDNIFEYLVVFGFGYLLIWGFISILFMPVLMRMKKPHQKQIKKEKDTYIERMEEQKESRKSLQEQQ